jgi:NitT/TauT family transport system substrate-binding protein
MKTIISLVLLLSLGLSSPVTAAPVNIRLGYLSNDLHHLAAWVALEKGFFRDVGISVTIAGVFHAGPEEMTAFASRSLDIGYLGVAPAMTGAANKAATVKVVALANTEGSAIVVRKDSRIRNLKDLIGKTVAIPGYSSVQDILLRRALEQAGIESKKITIMVIKPPEMIPALDTKQIDAFVAWEPYPARAVTRGIGKVIISSSEIWRNHPCCVVAVEGSFYEHNRAIISAFLGAHRKATDFIGTHPDEALRIAMKYTGMDEPTIREAMKNITYQYAIDRAAMKEYAGYLLRFQYIKPMDINAFTNGFIDMHGLEEIAR